MSSQPVFTVQSAYNGYTRLAEDESSLIQVQPGAPPTPPGFRVQEMQMFMPRPMTATNVPPGLEYLGRIDRIQIRQLPELAECLLRWEATNKYIILNGNGQQVYRAYEESGNCDRFCCGPERGFVIHVVDNYNQEVMRISRPYNCCAGPGHCWCAVPGSCCSHELKVEAPPGNLIGTVQQRRSGCSNAYIVLDEGGKPLLDIDGQCYTMLHSCHDKIFPVKTMCGLQIGEVKKTWAGFLQETFTEADNYEVSFLMELPTLAKATMIGATFLIDFMNFEAIKRARPLRRHW